MEVFRKIAIMQPTYLPWCGYFDLIDSVDAFVFLDNVQFQKGSWQQRNKVRTALDLEWLTVPVMKSGLSEQLISETRTSNSFFIEKHLRTLKLNYERARFYQPYYSILQRELPALGSKGMLGDLNIGLIKSLCDFMEIKTPTFSSSSLGCTGKRSELIINICNRLGATEYLSTVGAREYLEQDRTLFDQAGIRVSIHNFEHPIYEQMYNPFMPFASTVDLIFNEGGRSLEVIRSGRGNSLCLSSRLSV